MDRRFEGKVVLVTGGNSGIGLAAAKAFAAEGAQVAITGRSAETLTTAAAQIGGNVLALRSDTSDLVQIRAMAEAVADRFGRVDVLYANAGVGAFTPLADVTEDQWDQIMDVNLKGVFFTVQQIAPLMGPGGAVVLCASVAAHVGPPTGAVYAASKAGVRSLARSLGHDLISRGIRVNSVSPGPIDTPIMSRTAGFTPQMLPAIHAQASAMSPMKRMGKAEEVAAAVLFLASDAASLITGVDLLVDGGQVSF